MIGSPRNGNYLEFIELISLDNNLLAQHIDNHGKRGAGHTSYLSSTIMEELIDVMRKQVLNEIFQQVKQSKYYSVSLDSTPDESHVDQLTLVLCYIENDGPVERFVMFMANKGHKVQEMFYAMLQFLQAYKIYLSNCRGQTYDNESSMNGMYNGLWAKFCKRTVLQNGFLVQLIHSA